MNNRNPSMKRNMIKMLIIVGILFGAVFGFIIGKKLLINHLLKNWTPPPQVVSAMKVTYSEWQPEINATGSLRATLGVNVTTEAAGMIDTIYFRAGDIVKKDALLVQLDIRPEIAQLHALQASAQLAEITYQRDKRQFAIKAISKEQLDTDAANVKSKNAQVEQQVAIIALKTIRAAFAGRLGISKVNPGQYVNPGDKITSLQTLDPIYVDFYLPQQELARIEIGQPVALTVNTYPNKLFNGKITTIDSLVDVTNRNIEIEATIANPDEQLFPGMFAYVTLQTGKPTRYLTLPQAAISFNPYGAIAYVIHPEGKDKNGKDILKVKQQFIVTGETRGDQIAILQGLNEGDNVVTSGQLKLKNGDTVIINNTVVPANNPSPSIVDHKG